MTMTISSTQYLSITSPFYNNSQAQESISATSYIAINRTALEHNIGLYRKIIGPTASLALVVKSNAYGHGIVEIGRLGQENPAVDWFCTATLSEALLLRRHGITKPILVMSIIDADPLLALEHAIDLIAYDIESLIALNHKAAAHGKSFNIHIKIDTGLSRFGINPAEAIAFIKQVSLLPYIKIHGIFSHFAESDNKDTAYSGQQLEQFEQVIRLLAQEDIHIPYKHTCNTAAITTVPGSRYNFVRIGAGAYGLKAAPFALEQAEKIIPDFALHPVMTWKTSILHTRTISAGSFVGYNRTHQVTQPTKIAILPIGYYEGYDRRFTNKGLVYVHNGSQGDYAPVIGRVCMNVTMIDISHLPHAQAGSPVTILGYDKTEAHHLAQLIQSYNPREITTRIHISIARIIT